MENAVDTLAVTLLFNIVFQGHEIDSVKSGASVPSIRFLIKMILIQLQYQSKYITNHGTKMV